MRIVVVLILSMGIVLLGFMVYLDLNDEKAAQKSPLIAFPSNPFFLLEINEITSTWNHFTETNMIWSEFTSNKDSVIKYDDIEKISQFLNDEQITQLINNGKVYIGGYNIDGKIELLCIQNIFMHKKENELFVNSDSVLKNILPSSNWAVKYLMPFVILSSNKELLDNSIENILNKLTISNEFIYEKTKKLSSQSSSFSCFIDFNQVNELFFSFDSSAITYLENNKGISNWFQFDFNYTPNAINIIGVSDCENQNLQISPQYINNPSLVPDDVDILSKERIKYIIDTAFYVVNPNRKNIQELELLHLKITNQFTKSEEELILIERPGSLTQDSYLSNKILLDSVLPNKFLNKDIRLVNSSFLLSLYKHDYIKGGVCYLDNQYFVISTYEGLKEWEYQLKQKKKISFDEAIFADRSSSFLDQAFSQVDYWSGKELKEIVNTFSHLKSNKVENNILNEISGVSWATSFLNEGYLHHAINIQKGLHEKEDQKVLWTNSVKPILKGPFVMENHKTGTRDIFIQDTTNSICLYSASGKLKWQIDIEQPIVGAVSQIDIYANSKWQMVFSTQDKLYVIDINGHNVDGFPISFDYLATSPVGIIDYDLNKDYRFLIAGNDNKIHNYNIYGKRVNGWNVPKTSSSVSIPIQHFSIAAKDYIFVNENNGTLSFLNRRGEKRHESINNIHIKASSDFITQKSYCIDSSYMVYVDSANKLQKVIFDGQVSPLNFNLDSTRKNIPFIYETYPSSFINYGFMSNEKLLIYGPEKQVYLDKEFSYSLNGNITLNSDHDYLILFNDKIDEIELIDSRFQEIPTLFRGSKKCAIGDLNNDGVDELITIINKTTLLCYQIAVSN